MLKARWEGGGANGDGRPGTAGSLSDFVRSLHTEAVKSEATADQEPDMDAGDEAADEGAPPSKSEGRVRPRPRTHERATRGRRMFWLTPLL